MVAGTCWCIRSRLPTDGYPAEWVGTLERLGQLDATTIVPGHGPVLHDKTYLYPVGDLLRSTVDQLDARLATVGPAMFHTVDDVRPGIDLTLFRIRFAGGDEEPGARFDQMAAELVDLASREASLR